MTASTTASKPARLFSLDALRGFDMFWILGAEGIFHSIAKVSGTPFWQTISDELTHPKWHGFHFYDLIFPLFLFISGVTTPYSVGRELENGKTKGQMLRRVVKRGLLLVLLGVIYNNGLVIKPIEEMRIASVLGRIGLAYMFANIIYIYAKEKVQVIWLTALLIGYWLLLKFTSAPGYPTGDLTMNGNFASYLDTLLVPGKLLYPGIHDPEGLVSTIPAISTGLLGILAGNFLKKSTFSDTKKAVYLFSAGVALWILAHIWNLDFPINKNLWSSSFALNVGGYSLMLLAAFYFIIDVKGYKSWAFFFKVIGMNSILIYMSGRFINWKYSNNAFFGWLGELAGDPYQIVITAITLVLVKWLFLYFMFKQKVFLRV